MSIIVPDIRITVSFSHQISNHTQMTIPAVFEKQTLAVHHKKFTTLTRPVRRGVRGGFRTNPPFLAGYTSRSTTGLVRRTMATTIVLLYAHRKASGRASGVARLRESYFTRERGWVWTSGRRDSLTDDSPRPPPRTGLSSDDT